MRDVNQDAQFPEVTLSAPRMKSSSKTKGIESARENGQPTIAPKAYRTVPNRVRELLSSEGGAMVYVKAKKFANIAKVDGRKARYTSLRYLTYTKNKNTNLLSHSTYQH